MTARPKTRREKIAAIAKTGDYNPEEAAVAQAMLDQLPATLDDIASQIKEAWGRGLEEQFAIGRLLSQAASLFPPDVRDRDGAGLVTGAPFGRWLKAQDFPFTRGTALLLRKAAERESEVRAQIATQSLGTARDIGVVMGVKHLLGYIKSKTAEVVETIDTTPADPAYDALRNASNRITGTDEEPLNAFLNMHVDDLTKAAGYIKRLAIAYSEARDARQR